MHAITVLLARALAILWAGFWLFFFVAESWAWHTPANVMAVWAGLGLLFLILAVAAWRWESAGGLLLMAVGGAAGVAYALWAPAHVRPAVRVITVVVLAAPPILAGALFLLHHHGSVTPQRAA